jgi:hypothetical protein
MFDAPIAGVFFALELTLQDFTVDSFSWVWGRSRQEVRICKRAKGCPT